MTTIVQAICVLALLTCNDSAPTTLPHVPGPAVVLPREIDLKPAKVRIRYPADFVEGKFAPVQGDDYHFFADALVLVEVSRAAQVDRARLPVGKESMPTISINSLDSENAKVFTSVIKPEWRTSIGGREVIKFPGYPGPYGEKLHCYLVPREKGTSLLLIASREFRVDGANGPTHYDWVIERIIADLRDID